MSPFEIAMLCLFAIVICIFCVACYKHHDINSHDPENIYVANIDKINRQIDSLAKAVEKLKNTTVPSNVDDLHPNVVLDMVQKINNIVCELNATTAATLDV